MFSGNPQMTPVSLSKLGLFLEDFGQEKGLGVTQWVNG